jgi:hypothetical protein
MLIVNAMLVYFIGKSTKMAMDYVVTLGFIHFILSLIVMAGCEGVSYGNWLWWLMMTLGHLIAGAGAELACYYLRDLRSIKVDHE